MSTVTMTERVYELYRNGEVTLEQAKAMEAELKKVEYRKVYNQRPEVKAKRAEYMRARNEKMKEGRQLLAMLVK